MAIQFGENVHSATGDAPNCRQATRSHETESGMWKMQSCRLKTCRVAPVEIRYI